MKNRGRKHNLIKCGIIIGIFEFIAILFGFIGIPPLLIFIYFYYDEQIDHSILDMGTVVELRLYNE
ncbi:MAG TPA: hypothetical protein VIS49_12420 [Cyclobacteriaceae bacterium]